MTFGAILEKHSNGKWTRIEDVFPIKHGDIPASYVIVYQRVGRVGMFLKKISMLSL